MDTSREIQSGCVLDERVTLTLDDLCRAARVRREWVQSLVDEGILEPVGRESRHWLFRGSSLRRMHKAMRLQHDLGINLAGIALILDLMDELETLRTKVGRFT